MSEKIFVTKATMPDMDEYFKEVKDLWDTHWITNMGPKHNQLEEMLSEYLDVEKDNIALFVNGHQALECIIEAFELGTEKNDKGELKNEVITTPFTFVSTTNAIVRKGLKPVFCDIKESDYTIDEKKIESLITDKTCAIIPVHVYGNICNVEEIEKIADKYGLKVIYDAAHAFGVKKDGVSCASYGDASIYSFHATKVFNTIEGGAVVFKDRKMKQTLNNWKNFGIIDPEHVEYIGGNAKMNEFAAAMGICNLRHIDDNIKKRKFIYDKYIERLSDIDGLSLNKVNEYESNYAYFPIRIDKINVSRDKLFEELEKNDIYSRKYFYPLTSQYDCYKDKFDSSLTPVALKIAEQILTLPIYPDLALEDVDRICDIICNKLK